MYTLQYRDCTTIVFTTSAVHYIPITAVQCAVHTALPAYKDDYGMTTVLNTDVVHHTVGVHGRLYILSSEDKTVPYTATQYTVPGVFLFPVLVVVLTV
jgi:hypothetical protein